MGDRDEPRRGDRRRLQLAAEARRPAGRASSQPIPRARQAGGGEVPATTTRSRRRRGRSNPEILRRIEPVGVLDRVADRPDARAELAPEQRARSRGSSSRKRSTARRPTAPLDFLADVRKGVWSEVYGGAPAKVDAYRRNLQRAYVETLADRINGRTAAVDDARAFFRGELKTLDADLRSGAGAHDRSRHAAAHRRRADADRTARSIRRCRTRPAARAHDAGRRTLRRVGRSGVVLGGLRDQTRVAERQSRSSAQLASSLERQRLIANSRTAKLANCDGAC